MKIFQGKKNYDLVILSNIFIDYYTCLETLFVRIFKFFENNLDKSKWHLNLLDKMNLEIPEVRKRLLSDKTYGMLKEILRFRHFKRYYFEFDYDRDRIDFLEKKYLVSYELIKKDLDNYKLFLNELAKNKNKNK
ncbi:MAG: hypothetical protein U9O87_09255 [Verrucomicrobiota bacterium]|nr:hypothetical protein [Verrucomicrobiota bacterium]